MADQRPRPVADQRPRPVRPGHSVHPLHPVQRRHLDELSGPFGTWQHAAGTKPHMGFGYCTDDVARTLTVDLLHGPEVGWDLVLPNAWRSLVYLRNAFNPENGQLRNFRDADGNWLDTAGSEDSSGRAMLALGITARDAPDAAMRSQAAAVFALALPAAGRFTALRSVSATILGCLAALDAGIAGETRTVLGELVGRLGAACEPCLADETWRWPEPVLTYENALIPNALIAAAVALDDPWLGRIGIGLLDWLLDATVRPDGTFSPIGSDGWWPRGGTRSRFDQQPIEAAATILAVSAAFDATGRDRYRAAGESAYAWFLGVNDVGLVVADVATGGCHDGLAADHVNLNQGAESTLMWAITLELTRRLRARTTPPVHRATRSADAERRVASPVTA